MPSNPNYDRYLTTATQIQRWRDFLSQCAAYVIINTAFVIIWATTGRGFFWPAFPIVGWAFGLSFQHFSVVIFGQISDADVRAKFRGESERAPE